MQTPGSPAALYRERPLERNTGVEKARYVMVQ